MPHPLVDQLHFARAEFVRCLDGLSADDAQRRLLPSNSLSWTVGHLANHENRYYVWRAQGRLIYPDLNDRVGFGRPASTPPLADMWAAWRAITAEADRYLLALTPDILTTHLVYDGTTHPESVGTMLLRSTYHYWFHTGEAHGLRQQMGHADLPEFVGALPAYRPG